ncbi:hypothetical protein [Levilactobacillus tujiorum]|uniref:Uncharacterized protein n=1 Tax=Levilactobacillus tujiorum TaxID=2912243 RepID=A0ABX1L950_9LACO|nr:hypothetical protein [Levilactobacillus tujiorum]MCH5465775.1 hypothetical protein [Levilactobacillus tujiorum]NLR12988.1 hypothetical protein [Lactobacillus sp. HBUAS51387]NLR30803.1 hypothetical protein [Levilactobacillus tujiorum]NLR31039.1 hypothetical protein [Levilactobacillus tujiorum]
MLTEELLNERKKFQMMTWRAQKHGAQIIERETMQQFTAAIAQQEAIVAAANRREVTPVG